MGGKRTENNTFTHWQAGGAEKQPEPPHRLKLERHLYKYGIQNAVLHYIT